MAGIPAADWADLEAFDAVEPIGSLHAEILMAHLQALLASAHLKRTRPFSAAEFMPFQPPPAAPSPQDVAADLRAALDAHNARRQAHG